jgi:hypothetical protein
LPCGLLLWQRLVQGHASLLSDISDAFLPGFLTSYLMTSGSVTRLPINASYIHTLLARERAVQKYIITSLLYTSMHGGSFY